MKKINKIILACFAILLALPTLLSGQQGNQPDTTISFEMPVTFRNDTAAFRLFLESPMGKRITDIKKIQRVEHTASCPSCPNPYGRLIYTVELFDDNQPTKLVTEEICEGDSTVFEDELLKDHAIRYAILPSTTGGNDTLVTYILSMLSKPERIIMDSICYGEFYLYRGDTLRQSTIRKDTLLAIEGCCDTIQTLVFRVKEQPTKAISKTIVDGEKFFFNGEFLTENAIKFDTLSGIDGECDTLVSLVLIVMPKDNRIHFFAEQTLGYEVGRSPINKDIYTSTHIGITVDPGKRWVWKAGLGWFPALDFNVPSELPELNEQPEEDDGWNDCNCEERKQRLSIHAGISYSIPMKVLSFWNGTGGIRLSLTADYAIGGPPVEDVESSEWALPGALDLQPGVYWQKIIKRGGTIITELGPSLQALNGANHVGGQLRFRFVMPTKKK